MSDNTTINLGGAGTNQAPTQPSNQPNSIDRKAAEAGIPKEFVNTEFLMATDNVELPSEGKYYPNGQSSVQVRLLTTEAENILTSPDLIKNGKVLDALLEHSIIDATLRPNDMLIGDKSAVLLSLRSSGYGDEYKIKMTCPECQEKYVTSVNLSELKYKPMTVLSDSNGEFLISLPKTKAQVKFRLLTGKDENILNKKVESLKKLKKNTGVSSFLTERFILQIMEVNGKRDKIYISSFINSMPASDSFYLREYIGLVDPGVDMSHEFECTNCGHIYEDVVPIQPNLFWPNSRT